eukprot:g2360.t1
MVNPHKRRRRYHDITTSGRRPGLGISAADADAVDSEEEEENGSGLSWAVRDPSTTSYRPTLGSVDATEPAGVNGDNEAGFLSFTVANDDDDGEEEEEDGNNEREKQSSGRAHQEAENQLWKQLKQSGISKPSAAPIPEKTTDTNLNNTSSNEMIPPRKLTSGETEISRGVMELTKKKKLSRTRNVHLIGAFAKHTTGFGAKYLNKFSGWKPGDRLGKGEDGVAVPIRAKVRPKLGGLGFGNFVEATHLSENRAARNDVFGENENDHANDNENDSSLSKDKRRRGTKSKHSWMDKLHKAVRDEDYANQSVNRNVIEGDNQKGLQSNNASISEQILWSATFESSAPSTSASMVVDMRGAQPKVIDTQQIREKGQEAEAQRGPKVEDEKKNPVFGEEMHFNLSKLFSEAATKLRKVGARFSDVASQRNRLQTDLQRAQQKLSMKKEIANSSSSSTSSKSTSTKMDSSQIQLLAEPSNNSNLIDIISWFTQCCQLVQKASCCAITQESSPESNKLKKVNDSLLNTTKHLLQTFNTLVKRSKEQYVGPAPSASFSTSSYRMALNLLDDVQNCLIPSLLCTAFQSSSYYLKWKPLQNVQDLEMILDQLRLLLRNNVNQESRAVDKETRRVSNSMFHSNQRPLGNLGIAVGAQLILPKVSALLRRAALRKTSSNTSSTSVWFPSNNEEATQASRSFFVLISNDFISSDGISVIQEEGKHWNDSNNNNPYGDSSTHDVIDYLAPPLSASSLSSGVSNGRHTRNDQNNTMANSLFRLLNEALRNKLSTWEPNFRTQMEESVEGEDQLVEEYQVESFQSADEMSFPHQWIFPWLQHDYCRTYFPENLYADVTSCLIRVLGDCWDPLSQCSEIADRKVANLVGAWQDILTKGTYLKILKKAVIPKLIILAKSIRSKYLVVPSSNAQSLIHGCKIFFQRFHIWRLVITESQYACLIVGEFFPSFLRALKYLALETAQFLSTEKDSNVKKGEENQREEQNQKDGQSRVAVEFTAENVLSLYEAGRKVVNVDDTAEHNGKSSNDQNHKTNTFVKEQLQVALQLLNGFLSMNPNAVDNVAVRVKFSYQKALLHYQRLQYNRRDENETTQKKKEVQHVTSGGVSFSTAHSSSLYSFMDVIEAQAGQEGITFLPWGGASGRRFQGNKLYQFGSDIIYVENGVIFYYDKTQMIGGEPVDLQLLIDKNRQH